MDIFHVFKTVKRVPNRAKRLILLWNQQPNKRLTMLSKKGDNDTFTETE